MEVHIYLVQYYQTISPYGYENSDLKNLYLSKQQLDAIHALTF